ncbi:hypothetical protein B0H19DRAFT_706029 [Mycena capillaripes]|nr:hypothetical protein B0H19DRAFT_706029 [Mycena capillaripes]
MLEVACLRARHIKLRPACFFFPPRRTTPQSRSVLPSGLCRRGLLLACVVPSTLA